MNFKHYTLLLLVALVAARNYPMYKQCDSRWGNQKLGTSAKTICDAGCAMSSVAMALGGIGKSYNPQTLNNWLKANGGYENGDGLVWGAVKPLGLSWVGKVGTSSISSSLAAGHVIIINVRNGGHWALATDMKGSTISVNDPRFDVGSYPVSEVKQGNVALYHVSGSLLGVMIDELQIAFNVNGRRDKMRQSESNLMIDQ